MFLFSCVKIKEGGLKQSHNSPVSFIVKKLSVCWEPTGSTSTLSTAFQREGRTADPVWSFYSDTTVVLSMPVKIVCFNDIADTGKRKHCVLFPLCSSFMSHIPMIAKGKVNDARLLAIKLIKGVRFVDNFPVLMVVLKQNLFTMLIGLHALQS